MLQVLRALSAQDLERRSIDVSDKLRDFPLFKNAQRIMVFYPLAGEPDLRGLMRQLLREKKLFLPVVDQHRSMLKPYPIGDLEHLTEGPYRTRQPEVVHAYTGAMPDCIIVPGVAFTVDGYRLGRGKGYYDRFLATLPQGVVTIGVCFSCQLVADLPTHPTRDQKVHYVITD
mgnify:CR=1 FL=1